MKTQYLYEFTGIIYIYWEKIVFTIRIKTENLVLTCENVRQKYKTYLTVREQFQDLIGKSWKN